jgi:pyrimidine operon attenuation protein/uracil phosphoribosyltransferase
MPEDNRIHLMDEADVRREVARMARQIVELNQGTDRLVLMGIHRRGTHIAAMLVDEIERAEGVRVATGSIDITLYRDDLGTIGPRPVVGESALPSSGLVAYTGRTVRAALNEIGDWGRPSRVLLCVLVDRGGRELPIQPDITGRTVEVERPDRVEVLVPEVDGSLGVDLVHPEADDA